MRETHLRQHRQTSKLGLIKVINDLFPGETLKTAYSIQEGVFCRLVNSALSVREVHQIDERLREWVAKDSSIQFLYHKEGYYQYDLEGHVARMVYPADTRTSLVEPFRIIPYHDGFIIDFGEMVATQGKQKIIPPYRLTENYEKTQNWLRNIRTELISDVNFYVKTGSSMELLTMAEALQEKEISIIADNILKQKRALRVLLISGPSSSGKTSFAQRLSTQLRVSGFRPIPLSLDDYYIDRDQTPLDEEGNPDYESINSIDLPLLRQHMSDLIDGKRVETPIYDFKTGMRAEKTHSIQVDEDEILVIEGIHALNPELFPNISRNLFYKIYISALFSLNVDMMNRIPTTEVRLMRRLVRDDRFRHISPEANLDQWPRVRKGEYENIFKFQEESDIMFNSSLIYELNVLRPFVEETLAKLGPDSKHLDTRDRLMNLLSFVTPMEDDKVPFNSILREFIGGSIYF